MSSVVAMSALVPFSVRLKASWDIQPRTIPTPNHNSLSKNKNPNVLHHSTPQSRITTTTTATKVLTASELLSLNIRSPSQGKSEELYLGYERWLPAAPKVKKPKSIYNAATLAYIGDCIYELFARRHFLFPPLNIEEYNARVMAVVRCEAQDALLKKLLGDDFLLEEERDVLRWGKNIASGKTRTTKRVGVAVYNRASSLETLVGFLYLTNVKRLEELMQKLGFSTGASTQLILEETKSKERTV
ncbi:uncharacterized protein LOC122666569 [Telopea speciosissima]|uniref:uncharacterized protein LOC122666569 n=1 Tax=Telopea speciosissima TaxID=54955 RepID=UPI001CC50808|nr:uncharacterized protein LOC122666569 [Telopea speciosissima]